MTQQEYDSFAQTNGSQYSQDKVYTRSTDHRGHYDHARSEIGKIKVMPSLNGMIPDIIRAFPELRSSQDVFRNALVHFVNLPWVKERMGDKGAVKTDAFTMLAEYERKQAERQTFDNLTELVEQQWMHVQANQGIGASELLLDCHRLYEILADYPQLRYRIDNIIGQMEARRWA